MAKHNKDDAPTIEDPSFFNEFDVPTRSIEIKPRRSKSRPRPPTLRQLTGMGAPREQLWNFSQLIVGASADADFVVAASGLQDKHALFEESAGQYRCRSLDGATISLNGVRVHSCTLAGGDRIDMGDVSFLFLE